MDHNDAVPLTMSLLSPNLEDKIRRAESPSRSRDRVSQLAAAVSIAPKSAAHLILKELSKRDSLGATNLQLDKAAQSLRVLI